MTKSTDQYHRCIILVETLNDLFGPDNKWDGMATAFQNVSTVRKVLLQAIAKIRKHLENILTADDRLRLTTGLTLDGLESEIKDLRSKSNNELEIIAHFLSLVVYLLGFDWGKGEPNRQVIYYQTAEQEAFDDAMRHPNEFYPKGKLEFQKRLEIASMLHEQGLRVAQIARIMRLSEPLTKHLLIRAGRLHRNAQTKNT